MGAQLNVGMLGCGCGGMQWEHMGVQAQLHVDALECICIGMQVPGMCMQTWQTVADQCKEKKKLTY